MKLLRSTFVAYCVASSASGFAPQLSNKPLSAAQRPTSAINPERHSSTSLFVGLHEQPASKISDEEIRKEEMFIQVLKEVRAAKEYLSWLIEESGPSPAEGTEEEEGPTLGEALAAKAAAGEVELFGGGGDAPPAPEQKEKETAYRPALRDDLGSTVLLSGTADATLLNILNNNFFGQDSVPNFEFTQIKALVEDVAAAKKKAISREARYNGLLDKLVIEPSSGSLPSKEELAGATSWIAELTSEEAGATLPKIGELAGECAGLNNVVVVVSGARSGAIDGWDALAAAGADGDAFRCTLLATGEVRDGGAEGGFYHVGPVGEEGAAAPGGTPPRLTRKTAYQLAAHALALDGTAGKALAAYEYPAEAMEAVAAPYAEGDFATRDEDGEAEADEFRDVKMEGRVIQAMRETGFTQVMELDVLVSKGLSAFKEYLENPPVRRESSYEKRRSERDEEDERIMAKLDADIAASKAREEAEAAEQRRIEIEGIAKEWAIKEYSLRMLGGDLDDSVNEKDFMVSTHAEAMAEAEKTYNMIHSEEYVKEQKRLEEDKVNVENKLFWEGMPPVLRKKREKMVEKVKKQYMDLLSEADLERIILNE